MTARADWQTIHANLLARIHERNWQPGDLIPGEAQLADEFGCSRTTVNRAMRELAEAGFVERRRRAGTRVAMHPVGRARLEIPVIRLEVEARGSKWSQSLLRRRIRVAPPMIGARMRLAGTRALYLKSLHLADGLPLLLEERWINAELLPSALDIDFSEISANEWLVQNAAYTSGDMTFSAMNADAVQARILETEPGTALLVADRTTWRNEKAITIVRLSHAPGYRLRAAL